MKGFDTRDEPAGTASISSSAPTPANVAAFSWRLTRRQNADVQELSVADAQAFGLSASWSKKKREKYLVDLERTISQIEEGVDGS